MLLFTPSVGLETGTGKSGLDACVPNSSHRLMELGIVAATPSLGRPVLYGWNESRTHHYLDTTCVLVLRFKDPWGPLTCCGLGCRPRRRVSPGLISPDFTSGQGVPCQLSRQWEGKPSRCQAQTSVWWGRSCENPHSPCYYPLRNPPLVTFLPRESLSHTFQPSYVSLAFVPSGQHEEPSRNEPQNTRCNVGDLTFEWMVFYLQLKLAFYTPKIYGKNLML